MTQRLLPAKSTNTLFYVSLRATACCLLVLLLTSISSRVLASTFYVKVDGTGSGALYWANASSDLQAVINAANPGDEIWVAAGTYKPGGNENTDRTISFSMKNGVSIYGGFTGNETTRSERPAINQTTPSTTILSGEIGDPFDTSDNSFHVIRNRLGVTSSTVLDGFVITGGNANEAGPVQEPNNLGGGIYNVRQSSFANPSSGLPSSPQISNCLFLDNFAISGAAIYNGGTSNQSGSVLTNCVFRNNIASENGGAIYNVGSFGSNIQPKMTNCLFQSNSAEAGGAVYNYGYFGSSSPEITNCSFQDNSAASGAAIYNDGESDASDSSPVLTNCSFKNNKASNQGGAIFNNGDFNGNSSPLIINCVFQSNSADSGGGAIFNLTGYVRNDNRARPKFTNCLFQSNAAVYGGAIYTDSVWEGEIELLLTNCTFQNNTVGGLGGAIAGNGYGNGYYSNTTLINCVLFGNGGNKTLWNPATTTTATYTLFDNSVTGYSGTTGNVKTTVSPFVSADNPTLLGCSPAVNAGLNSAAGLAGVNFDLAGNPRIFEGRVDMGAYEYQAAQGLAITVPSVNTATVGTAFSQSFTALGETAGSTSYSLASGSLPAGLILASNGTLSGTPTQAGSFSITVNATNGNCTGVSAAYVLEVASNTPIRYVVAGATGSGNSWTDASGDLQSQIDYVGAEQVWVAAGTYNPSKTDRSVSFSMKNGVPIYGGFEGTETDLNRRVLRYPLTTILSGEIGDEEDTDNSYHVIRNAAGLTNSAVLDGFMITGGNASGGIADDSGGGMINDGGGENNNCSPLIRNCLFVNNRADNGGGAIYNGGYTNGNSNPTIVNCAFQNNAASKGGAIFNDGSINGNSNASIINCSFQGNSSPSGGAIGNVSYRGTSRPVLTNCVVWGNGGSSTFNNQQGAFILTSYSLFESTVTGYNGGTGNLTTTTSPFVRDNNTRLRANAEAIDAGDPNSTSAVNGATDLAGNPRFGGGRIDMGAFEFDAAALPVSLVSFTAQVQSDQTVLLKWQTAAEWNNKGYLIERSKDLKNFESVGQVSDVGGTSNLSQGYRFIDTNPYQGTSYYRLKQVDLDGSSHTYSVKSVIIKGNYGVYPNPVVGQQFTLNLDEPAGAILRLYSVTGREISFTHSEISSGSTLIKLASKLTSGIYLLSVEERGNLRVYRLVVQ